MGEETRLQLLVIRHNGGPIEVLSFTLVAFRATCRLGIKLHPLFERLAPFGTMEASLNPQYDSEVMFREVSRGPSSGPP